MKSQKKVVLHDVPCRELAEAFESLIQQSIAFSKVSGELDRLRKEQATLLDKINRNRKALNLGALAEDFSIVF